MLANLFKQVRFVHQKKENILMYTKNLSCKLSVT